MKIALNPRRTISLLVLILFTLNTISCTARLNRKEDYNISREALRLGNPQMALVNLPDNERNSFISVMERTYLSLLSGGDDIDDLLRYSEIFDRQIRYDVSREVSSFFYANLPEGYYASEHEIIWTHILLAWGFSKRADIENGEVEAKKAANLLSMKWSPEGRFDDPLMRIMLASIWVSLGNWDEAQVDFRKAYELDRTLTWAKQLGDMDQMPKNFYLVLGGIGMEPGEKNGTTHLYTMGEIPFYSEANKSKLFTQDTKGKKIQLSMTPDSSKWYKRHQQRDNSIREVINKSNYGMRVTAQQAVRAATITGVVLVGTTIILVSIGVGGAIIVIGVAAGSEDGASVATLGLGVLISGVTLGGKYIKYYTNLANENYRASTDLSRIYRYVRFLPEYSWVGWNSRDGIPSTFLDEKNNKLSLFKCSEFNNSNCMVAFFFHPDSGNVNFNSLSSNITTTLLTSSYHQDIEVQPNLTPNGKQPENSQKFAELIRAVQDNNFKLVRKLVEQDAPIKQHNTLGFTPLYYAVKLGNAEMINYLCDHGAESSEQFPMLNDYSYLHIAAANDNADAIRALCNHGAFVESRDKENNTPLLLASSLNKINAVTALIECKADVNFSQRSGWTPLLAAVEGDNPEIVQLLINANAYTDPALIKRHGKHAVGSTPLSLAKTLGRPEIIMILEKQHAR